MARLRTFRDYLTASGRNDIQAWLKKLPPAQRMVIDRTIAKLEQLTDPSAHMPYIGDGLHKIKLTTANVQFRPICVVSVEREEVVILYGATERDGKFAPPTALEEAKKRRAAVVADWEGRSCEHQFD